MHDDIRKVFLMKSITIEHRNGKRQTATESGFFAFDQQVWFIADTPLLGNSVLPIESAFVCMSMDRPGKLFKDAFPDLITNEWTPNSCTISTPSMLFSWHFKDTVPLSNDEDLPIEADYHVDVKAAAASINKYMKRPIQQTIDNCKVEPVPPKAVVSIQHIVTSNGGKKRPRDAREFREKILSTGAQAEFYVWNHIKAVYGDEADLSWWVSSTKRQFFPNDMTHIDDGLGSDFIIPSDTRGLFGSQKGNTIHIEVKGTGGRLDEVSFEVSRNELARAKEMNKPETGNEFLVVVISCLNARPKLEAVVRDLDSLELIPTRFLATVPRTLVSQNPDTEGPHLTKSSWY
jgi:hypothetical protein